MGLIGCILAIMGFIVILGPVLVPLITSCMSSVFVTGLLVLAAPFIWIIDYFCKRQQRRIKIRIDKAMEEGADKGRIYFLNMQYEEAEERQEKLVNFTCTTIALTVFIIIRVFITFQIPEISYSLNRNVNL